MIEYCDISEHDLKLLLSGDNDEYNIHYYTDEGTEVIIRKGDCDDLLDGGMDDGSDITTEKRS